MMSTFTVCSMLCLVAIGMVTMAVAKPEKAPDDVCLGDVCPGGEEQRRLPPTGAKSEEIGASIVLLQTKAEVDLVDGSEPMHAGLAVANIANHKAAVLTAIAKHDAGGKAAAIAAAAASTVGSEAGAVSRGTASKKSIDVLCHERTDITITVCCAQAGLQQKEACKASGCMWYPWHGDQINVCSALGTLLFGTKLYSSGELRPEYITATFENKECDPQEEAGGKPCLHMADGGFWELPPAAAPGQYVIKLLANCESGDASVSLSRLNRGKNEGSFVQLNCNMRVFIDGIERTVLDGWSNSFRLGVEVDLEIVIDADVGAEISFSLAMNQATAAWDHCAETKECLKTLDVATNSHGSALRNNKAKQQKCLNDELLDNPQENALCVNFKTCAGDQRTTDVLKGLLTLTLGLAATWSASNAKHFSNVCANVGGSTAGSLFECKALCEQSPIGCNAVNYKPSSVIAIAVCVLRACPDPIASPTESASGWVSYNIVQAWSASNANVFSAGQCPSIGGSTAGSLFECKALCEQSTIGCTAVNYQPSSVIAIARCVLRACPDPIPSPTVSASGWVSYNFVQASSLAQDALFQRKMGDKTLVPRGSDREGLGDMANFSVGQQQVPHCQNPAVLDVESWDCDCHPAMLEACPCCEAGSTSLWTTAGCQSCLMVEICKTNGICPDWKANNGCDGYQAHSNSVCAGSVALQQRAANKHGMAADLDKATAAKTGCLSDRSNNR